MKAPCFQCPDRSAHCHADCPRYAAYAAERAKILEARRKDHDAISALIAGASKIKDEKYRKSKGK